MDEGVRVISGMDNTVCLILPVACHLVMERSVGVARGWTVVVRTT